MNFSKKNLDKNTKKELKNAEKEKKRCRKLYLDWKDDEYNCGPLKFIWGVKSHDDLTASEVNFYSMNDIDIVYNRDTHKYLLGLETIYEFHSVDEKMKYLDNLLKEFEKYIKESNQFDCKFDPYFLYFYNFGELFIADTLTELYYKFKIFVEGYKQL